jgi:hypothetical protein
MQGIIKVQDGKVQASFTLKNAPRASPSFFENDQPDHWTVTLRRATDYDLLEGIWRKEERNPVTGEISRAEELFFKKNLYVRRVFRTITAYNDDIPREYLLNQTTVPKQIDLEIKSLDVEKSRYASLLTGKDWFNKEQFLKSLEGNQFHERQLGIYDLNDNEFRYVITGGIPFTVENNQLAVNRNSPLNKRATSFAAANGAILTYKRVERSLKSSTNTRPETPDDPRIKPATVTPGETPTRERTAVSPTLQDLRQQRLKLARERLKLWQFNEAGGSQKASIEELGTISQQILDASMALSQNRADSLRIWDEHLKMLKQIEEKVCVQVKAGTRNPDDLLAAQLRRIEVEIKIEERKELEKSMDAINQQMKEKR